MLNPFVGDVWFNSTYKVAPLVIAILTLNFYVAVMVYPVESFRTANGLFVQGWMRPIIMALLNIILDFYMGRRWGVVGIFLATTISRVATQVWFDPYLVYKIVFKKKPWRFLADYVLKMVIAFIVCAITGIITGLINLPNVYLSFVCKFILAMTIPIALLTLLYWKNENYRYLIGTARSKLLRK